MKPIPHAIYLLYGQTQRAGEAAFMAGIHGNLMFTSIDIVKVSNR